MKAWILAATLVAGVGAAGAAMAQRDVIAERKTGMREMGRHLEAIQQVLQSRGNQAAIAERADRIIAFYNDLNAIYPGPTLTPPVPQGRNEGQTRALASIESNRAAFTNYANDMVRQLTAMKTAAATGGVNADMLRGAGQVCAACHDQFRAR
jgi:cytochrome c556